MQRDEPAVPAAEVRERTVPSGISQALKALDAGALAEDEADLRVLPARDARDLDCVYCLTHDAYLAKGYCLPQPQGRLIHYPHLDGIPETTVLIAILNGGIAGTNSLTLDGPCGLHVDHDFKPECDAIRAEGRRLAASWRIATSASLRSETRVVLALIQETVRQALLAGVETCVFTFNPRHERIYKRLLNMQTVAARLESVAGLANAPAVFMRLDMERIPERWLDTPELSAIAAGMRERHPQAAAVA